MVGVTFPVPHAQLAMVVGVFTVRVSNVQNLRYVLTLRPWISHPAERRADLCEVGAEEAQQKLLDDLQGIGVEASGGVAVSLDVQE
ncbi:hypothetical protein AMK18_23825 [Streptomyces sp. CB01249]|nr:hypothetical protein AMK18_23825 [Streptomyces sp. CB01249]